MKVELDAYRELYRPRSAAAVSRGREIEPSAIERGRARRLTLRQEIMSLMVDAGVDAWVLPSSNGPAPEGLEVTGWADMTGLWSYAGLPCVSIPAGVSAKGLPLGLQLVGAHGHDECLLSVASPVASRIGLLPSTDR